jgi:hypothetical protein
MYSVGGDRMGRRPRQPAERRLESDSADPFAGKATAEAAEHTVIVAAVAGIVTAVGVNRANEAAAAGDTAVAAVPGKGNADAAGP